MAEQIFSIDGNYLAINSDGSINTTTSLSASFDDVESILTAISGNTDQIEGYVDQIEAYTKTQSDVNISSRIVEVLGTDTYIALAPAGTAQISALWQVQKIDTNGSRQWADGNTNFDNVGSSPLSGLTYSY